MGIIVLFLMLVDWDKLAREAYRASLAAFDEMWLSNQVKIPTLLASLPKPKRGAVEIGISNSYKPRKLVGDMRFKLGL